MEVCRSPGNGINYSHNRTTTQPTPKPRQTTLTRSDPNNIINLNGELYPKERLKSKVLPLLPHKFKVLITTYTPLWPLLLHLPAITVTPTRIELQTDTIYLPSSSVHSSSTHTSHLPSRKGNKIQKKNGNGPPPSKTIYISAPNTHESESSSSRLALPNTSIRALLGCYLYWAGFREGESGTEVGSIPSLGIPR